MKMSEDKPTVFSEWEDCDCNQCERYWDSSCDGVKKDTKKLCGQFLATRKVVIPLQIQRLESKVFSLQVSVVVLAIVTLGLSLLEVFQ